MQIITIMVIIICNYLVNKNEGVINMNEQEKVIEKHILQYLFTHDEFNFKYDNAGFDLYEIIGTSIAKELNISILGSDDFKKVLDDLIEKKMVEKKYDKESGQFKNGTLKLNLTSSVREYVIEQGYVTTEVTINYIDNKYFDTIKMFMAQIKRLESLESDLENQKKELLSKIDEQDQQIRNFNNSIISIMAILIAAFAIIGFNIGGIKFIAGNNEVLKPWEYAGSIALLNLSIVFSLYFLFYLLDKIINSKTTNNNRQVISEDNTQPNKKLFNIFDNKLVMFLLTIIIIMILICFFIA